MNIKHLKLNNHPVLGNQLIDFINPKTNKTYSTVVFVGENGVGKTSLLNELFHYSTSESIIEKETKDEGVPFQALYIRQNNLYCNAINELTKIINGEQEYAYLTEQTDLSVSTKIEVDSKTKVLEQLEDNTIISLHKEGKIDGFKCGGRAAELIDGTKSSLKVNEISSGQQEIILKLKALNEVNKNTDFVLLDEPEASLHPRWQRNIVSLIKEILGSNDLVIPQLFVSTHSEKVLESLVGKEDVCIFRLFKKDGAPVIECVEHMNEMCLPKITFSELDYVVFGIETFEYHDALLTEFSCLNEVESIAAIDRAIRDNPLYEVEKHQKKWISTATFKGVVKEVSYRTLPIYIRNYFHHPKEGKEPTKEELIRSIEFLRQLIVTHKNS